MRALLAFPFLAACVESPPPDPPDARGPLFVTTPTGDMPVYVNDAGGVLRGGYRSDPLGNVTVEVADGWSVTLVDLDNGLRRVRTVVGVSPDGSLELGDVRAIGGAAPLPLRVAPLAPVDGAGGYTISVCGPAIVRTPVVEAGAEATVYYRPLALDDDGGALVIAESDTGAFAIVDVADLPAQKDPIVFPAWQSAAAQASWFVGAPTGAERVELAVRSAHGCAIGTGGGDGDTVAATFYPGLAIDTIDASAWYRRDALATSRAIRRVRADTLTEPVLDLTDPPARIDDVAVQVTPGAMLVSWTEDGDDRGGSIEIATAPSPDTEWTLDAARGATHLVLPAIPEVQPAQPAWTTVTLAVDDWTSIGARFTP